MFALTFGKETSYNFLEKFLKEKIKMWMYPQRRATSQYIIHMKKSLCSPREIDISHSRFSM